MTHTKRNFLALAYAATPPTLCRGDILGVHMDKAFSAEQWGRLSTSGRVVLCHRIAEETEGEAELAAPQFQETLKRIAGRWLEVAAGLEVAR